MAVTEMPPQGNFVSQTQNYWENPFFHRRGLPDQLRNHMVHPPNSPEAQAALVHAAMRAGSTPEGGHESPLKMHAIERLRLPQQLRLCRCATRLPRLETYEKSI